ncbi:ankyrin repeat domain-containing protein, partial [Wolbachia endosymbiont of Pentalonia nigronervosa]|uniref:ankyrin repeat domain-containing protein n=1 Tax=Wolbachia endosymbiont of Pentalonia nigronervosa TaxID=1301914 RepID=UPI00165FE84B
MLKTRYPASYLKKEELKSQIQEEQQYREQSRKALQDLKRVKRTNDNPELPEGFKVEQAIRRSGSSKGNKLSESQPEQHVKLVKQQPDLPGNRVKRADNESGPSNANQGNQQSPYDGSQSDRDNQPIDSAQHHQINLNSPDFIDSDDERGKNTELFTAIRKGELQKVQELLEAGVKTDIIDKNNKDNKPLHYAVEKGKKEIVEELLLPKWKTDINAKNNKGGTPLHIATSKSDKKLVELLLNNQAEVGMRNNDDEIPLDIAKRLDKQDIVGILKSHTQPTLQSYVKEQSADQQFQQSFYSKESGDQEKNKQYSNKVKEIAQKRSSKRRAGTASSGDSYEIDLLMLGKIRGESDTDRFYLDTNVDGLGAFDDIVFRYWNEEKSTIILLQAKHVEDLKKGKVTIEKFTNPKNDKFYLGKYFSDYLNSRERFNNKSKDPIFQGNFKELDLKYIIYTNSILDE